MGVTECEQIAYPGWCQIGFCVGREPVAVGVESKFETELFGIGVDEIAGNGLGSSLFEAGVDMFEVLVVKRMDNAKAREFLGGV